MLRGEFIRADGLVIPNNVTDYGAAQILAFAFLNTGYDLHVALANAVPNTELQLEELAEPTIGVNGYARIPVTRDAVGWPVTGVLNGQQYIETDWLIWAAVDGPFDKPATRLALVNSLTDVLGAEVLALSSAFPTEVTVDVDTPEADRKFKYRLYLR